MRWYNVSIFFIDDGDVEIRTEKNFTSKDRLVALNISKTVSDDVDDRSAIQSALLDESTTEVNSSTQRNDITTTTPDEQSGDEKQKANRTPFLSRRPFRRAGLRQSRSEKIALPAASTHVKHIRNSYVYIFSNFEKRNFEPNKRLFWKQFYHTES